MSMNLVNVDRSTPMLLPVDMREWLPADDVVHLVLDAVAGMDLSAAAINERGTGSAQYPPGMMVGLLIYSYSQGLFSSRRIERATHTHIGVRYVTGDTHPDHDTIATFRRRHGELLQRAFVEVLQLARQLGVAQLGTVCLDGTKIKANASERHNRREAELRQEVRALEQEVSQRMQAAERADQDERTSEQLPAELKDRQQRLAKLQAARAAIKKRATAQDRDPHDDDKGNPTDPDSRIQRKPQGFVQGYNAQLGVSAESGLIVAAQVTAETDDRRQLAPMVAAIPPVAGQPHTVVADRGYDNHAQVEAVTRLGAKVCVPPQGPLSSGRSPRRTSLAEKDKMTARLRRLAETSGRWGQQMRRLRQCVIEPVFGTLKHNWRFHCFHLRGLAGVNIEWLLLCTAYNLRKIHRLTTLAVG
jgi:transposase